MQRDELKKFDEDGEKDEDNHDDDKVDGEDDVNDEDDDNYEDDVNDEDVVNDEDDDKSYDLWEDDYLGQCWSAGPWAVRGGIGIFWAALDPDPHIMTFCLQETQRLTNCWSSDFDQSIMTTEMLKYIELVISCIWLSDCLVCFNFVSLLIVMIPTSLAEFLHVFLIGLIGVKVSEFLFLQTVGNLAAQPTLHPCCSCCGKQPAIGMEVLFLDFIM